MFRWGTLLLAILGSFSRLGVNFESARADDKALTTIIPRESISGSGYRALRALEPELFVYRDTPEKWKKYSTPEGMKEAQALAAKSLAYPIELAIGKLRPRKDGRADQGFAVRGEGRDALPGIYDVFVKGTQPSKTFPTGTPISIVFFAPPSMPVRLDRVERTNGKITIRYMLLTSNLRTRPWHLSIIPLGKLPAGEYDVEMLRSHEKEKESNPPDFPPVPPDTERGIICRPFSFVVADGLNCVDVQTGAQPVSIPWKPIANSFPEANRASSIRHRTFPIPLGLSFIAQ